ncbi:MAG TPA: hypothetical protein VH595_12145 [Verrucomicrobiae bacterium]|jgi:hypothetical protein|nr:hypothetical protein [Verrucomicrobiae bacterium]
MALPERPRRFSGRYFHLYTRLIVHAPNGKQGLDMKAFVLLSMLMTMTISASAMDRLNALWMLESGGNDYLVGKVGERSRYQVRPAVWRTVTVSRAFTQPKVARYVAATVMDRRSREFEVRFGRPPTDFEYYGLWNAPGEVLSRHLSRSVAKRCERFRNLCDLAVR